MVALCVGYSFVALLLLFDPQGGSPAAGSNFAPFDTIGAQIRQGATIQLVGNALLLAPVGFTIAFWGIRLGRTLAILVSVAVGIEALQALVGRVTDIDDAILNVSGGFVGALIGAGVLGLVRLLQSSD